ncbi:hypothetical protein CkP1_0102 [Citrobacter phage CkP1]|nr:hypothetical protein CkP1_0102 [Citrobacter phage CkP1]
MTLMSIYLMLFFLFVLMIYLTIGWMIANALVKRGAIEDVVNYLFSIILWLPSGVAMTFWIILKWFFTWPKRFAEAQIEKHSK